MEVEYLSRLQPGIQHVVGVPDPGNGFSLDGAAMLDESENVREYLTGMVFVGQAIDDRNA